ncbi:hypothetical protein QPK13_23055 [Photorhabdus tasmaniensis]
MKSAILTTLMLVAVSSQPVLAAQCQYGACNVGSDAGSGVLLSVAQTDKDMVLKRLNDASNASESMSKRMDGYLNNDKLKVNTDSTRKGPGNSISTPADELAPVRQLKAIRPELVLYPLSQPVITFNERMA